MSKKKQVCFVCLGNIVRSPLAENLFRHLVEQAGLGDKYEVDSAGTSAWHVGESPDPRMRRVAAIHGLKYDGRARKFNSEDFERFDFILVMDSENLAVLNRIARTEEQKNKIYLLREFDPQGGKTAAVPDPYYGGISGFEETYSIVERSVRGLLEHLEGGQI